MVTSPKFPVLPARQLPDGPKPKHAQLREILEDICTTELRPGDMLPGERVLEDTFGVSRITVRRAIGDLVASGRLKRARGRGTFVAPAPLISRLHLASFSSEMSAQGLTATSDVLLAEAAATPPVEVEAFFRSGDHPHTHLRRLRLGDGLPYAIDDSWYNNVHVAGILDHDVHASVYGILDGEYGLPVTEAEQIATAVNADADTARVLDVEPGTALLKIVRMSLSGDRPVEWCSSLYRTDRYTLKTHVERATEQPTD
ncbi:GntR family transcriptional regulator [Corynebacterium pygosceleis]|uniref:GntR family transcriptional regulator n=1 Tax=Corynebacterium pygosceleis TaxID=2800406 RepID=A0A9Q4CAN5_9CORY|nr:GntR family transcriptional regulator [Corynebacterium pygosceleis]MCK7638240.1 GntR family transcriptional regulator [Corynebacterium pygosceleis]MCK7676235.1 GntR family transcriptional regulator [Corynebacterium pygosceleis]MCL0121606.1 GntR family transcriptional regulator [Corynebacterium pygosceleis]MCX7445799.1 GntR family transcriptional regulator [Corynebacterium pygosceleis]MCX7469396.1 GntR family transcriptional regulator [Corynebacterium pygosceleis]